MLLATFAPLAAQRLIATKTVIDVGRTGFQQPVTAVFEFRNKSIRRLKIEGVDVDCNCTVVEYPKTVIGMGEHFQIKMTYDAQQMGHFDKQAAIISNGTTKPVYIRMKGVVVAEVQNMGASYPVDMGELLADRNELEFDNVNKGDTPVQQLHIYNNGTRALHPYLMHLPSYLSATVTPEQIGPGRSATVNVTLNSSHISSYGLTQATIYLAANPGDKASADCQIGVSTVLLPHFSPISEKQKQYMPKMHLSQDSIGFDFHGKQKLSKVILISNVGRTALKISSLQMFTGGLKISLSKRELQPGETAKLKVTAQRSELLKVRTRPRVLMITNDPDNAKVVIPIGVK